MVPDRSPPSWWSTRIAGSIPTSRTSPDGLSPVGGYPGNDDDGRTLQAGLDPGKLRTDMLNGARYLKSHALSSGKLGVTGFCWGGGTTNFLAVTLGDDVKAGVP